MKKFSYLLIVLMALSLLPSYAKRKKNASKQDIPSLGEQLQGIANNGYRLVRSFDQLTSTVVFQLKTDKDGVVTDRSIMEPILHWAHAKMVYNYLQGIKQLPSTGEEQTIVANINLKDCIAQPAAIKNLVEIKSPIVLPRFKGSVEYDEFIKAVIPLEERIARVSVKDSLVRIELKHLASGAVLEGKMYSLKEGMTKFGNKIMGAEWTNHRGDWTPALVNGKPHLYIGSDEVNLYATLTPEEYQQALKRRAKIDLDKLEKPFLFAENMPSFRGGNLKDFRSYVLSQIKYPRHLAEAYISGRVVATFIINKDGSVSFDKIISSPHEDFSKVVIEIIEGSSGEWTPATQRGVPVRIKYTLPIEFNLGKPASKNTDALQVVSYGTPRR